MKRLPRWLLLAGFALVIFGGKLHLIEAAGYDFPQMDAWDAESETLFRPWLEGRLTAADLFRPHNEHRVVTTKLFTLGLLIANGQWSVLLETTANAAIHTLAAVTLLLLSGRWLRGIALVAMAGLLILLFTLPSTWENTLNGFQVQFYFLLLFSLLHLWFTLAADRFTWRWFAGQLCGALAVVSMASGFFSSAVILAIVTTRMLAARRVQALSLVTALLALGFTLAGWLLKHPFPGHESLRAHSLGDFTRSFAQLIAWPGPAWLPWIFAPALLFLLRRAIHRTFATVDPVLIGLLGWSVLQCAALAYGRGGGESVVSSRYLDLLSVSLALGLVFLVTELGGRSRQILATTWLLAAVTMLILSSLDQWRGAIALDLPVHARQQENLRHYLRSLEPRDLTGHPWPDIPYPDATALLQRLQSPAIRAIMPPSVRRSVPLRVAAPTAPVSVPATLPDSPAPIAVSTFSLAPAETFTWHSAHQPVGPLALLRFRVAGDLGPADQSLRLVVSTQSETLPLTPDQPSGTRWKTLNLPSPTTEWWLEARDAAPSRWFAVTEPVEVGRGSWLAEKLLKHHFVFLVLGGALLLAGGALALFRRDASPGTV